jgi:endonuclease III
MSAQATDKQVNKITDRLFKIVSNPKDILDM